jgi:hypothetical protein
VLIVGPAIRSVSYFRFEVVRPRRSWATHRVRMRARRSSVVRPYAKPAKATCSGSVGPLGAFGGGPSTRGACPFAEWIRCVGTGR